MRLSIEARLTRAAVAGMALRVGGKGCVLTLRTKVADELGQANRVNYKPVYIDSSFLAQNAL